MPKVQGPKRAKAPSQAPLRGPVRKGHNRRTHGLTGNGCNLCLWGVEVDESFFKNIKPRGKDEVLSNLNRVGLQKNAILVSDGFGRGATNEPFPGRQRMQLVFLAR